MRTDLKVPFSEKDEAKKLGARWDAARRIWYTQGQDLTAFARWMPDSAPDRTPATASPTKAVSAKAKEAPLVNTGSRFVELACDCLPWEGCAKCREALAARGWNPPG